MNVVHSMHGYTISCSYTAGTEFQQTRLMFTGSCTLINGAKYAVQYRVHTVQYIIICQLTVTNVPIYHAWTQSESKFFYMPRHRKSIQTYTYKSAKKYVRTYKNDSFKRKPVALRTPH